MDEWFLLQFENVFDDFYRRCDSDLQVAIDECLDYFCQHGNKTQMPYSRHLGDGIAEFRPGTNRVEARFLYFYHPTRRRTAVIAVAFKKKTRATPQKFLKRAKDIKTLVISNPGIVDELSFYN